MPAAKHPLDCRKPAPGHTTQEGEGPHAASKIRLLGLGRQRHDKGLFGVAPTQTQQLRGELFIDDSALTTVCLAICPGVCSRSEGGPEGQRDHSFHHPCFWDILSGLVQRCTNPFCDSVGPHCLLAAVLELPPVRSPA